MVHVREGHGAWKRGLLAAAAVVALARCAGCGPLDDEGSTVPETCEAESPVVPAQKTDILFVIDNSGSMREEQVGVATELPAFVSRLVQGSGVAQDFRVGVITTSVYEYLSVNGSAVENRTFPEEAGRLRPVPPAADGGVAPGAGERVLEGEDPQLVEKFRRLVQQGTGGSGQETPFEAVRLAVSEPLVSQPLEQGGNGGFLRDGARLLVVVVTDEEDCSTTARPPPFGLTVNAPTDECADGAAQLTSVAEYEAAFRGLKNSDGTAKEVLWAAIAPVALTTKEARSEPNPGGGVRNVDCPTSFGAGVRHRDMAGRFDEALLNLGSVCQASYQQQLVDIAELATVAQSIEVVNLPDPALAVVEVTRADGAVQRCTTAGGELRYEAPVEGRPARLFFLGGCPRRAGDQEVKIRLLCAG